MRLNQVEEKARQTGINDTWKYSKRELIRAIQHKEGFAECFSTGKRACDQLNCCWREDCIR